MIGGIKFDVSEIVNNVTNLAEYTDGYIRTLTQDQSYVNMLVGNASIEALYSYIDAMAPMNPGKLAHVYEPDGLGDPSKRLFKFELGEVNFNYVEIEATFLESQVAPKSGHVFQNRARVMEAGATITVRPKNGKVLVFEDDGETIFTASAVTIEHPGGPDAEQGFADTVQVFFTSVATRMVMEPIMRKLASFDLYERNVAVGVKGGRTAGINTGKLKLSEVQHVTF